MAEALAHGSFQCVIGRVGNARDLAGRGELATARRIGEGAAGIEPPLIGIAGIRNRLAIHSSGNEYGWVCFDKARKVRALRAHISKLEEHILSERAL